MGECGASVRGARAAAVAAVALGCAQAVIDLPSPGEPVPVIAVRGMLLLALAVAAVEVGRLGRLLAPAILLPLPPLMIKLAGAGIDGERFLAVGAVTMTDPLAHAVANAAAMTLLAVAVLLLAAGRRRGWAGIAAALAGVVAVDVIVGDTVAALSADLEVGSAGTDDVLTLLVSAAVVLRAVGAVAPRRRGLSAAVGLFAGFSLAAAGAAAWIDYHHTLSAARARTGHVVQLLGEHARRALDPAYLVTKLVADQVAAKGLERAMRDGFGPLGALVRDLPQTAGVGIVDAGGRVALWTEEWPLPPALPTLAGHHRAGAETFIAPRLEGALFAVSRRLAAPAGEFAGFAFALVPTEYFTEFYHSLSLGPGGFIGVYRPDGDLLVRQPAPAETSGRGYPGSPMFGRYLPKAPAGSMVAVSPVDGVRRLMSYHAAQSPPVVIAAGIPIAAVMAEWQDRFLVQAAILAIVLAALAWLVRRHAAALAAQEAALARLGDSESRLRSAEARFHSMVDSVPAMIWVGLPDDLRLEFLNRVGLDYLGQPTERALAFGWQFAVHPDDLPRVAAVWSEGVRNRAPFSVDFRMLRADGVYRWQSAAGVPRFGAAGEFLGHIGTCTDITELRSAQDAVLRHTAVLEAMVAGVPDALLLEDDAGDVLLVNPAFSRLFGIPGHEAIGRPVAVLAETLDLPVEDGGELGFVRHYRPAAAPAFVGETAVQPVRDGRGRVWGRLRIIRDVSEMAEATRAVQAARRAAEAANAAKTRFLAAASHDLRQPLHAVNLFVDSLRKRVRGGEAGALVEDIHRSLGALDEMFGHLLDMSRLDAGVVPPEVVDVPVARTLDRVAAEAARLAQEKGLRFRCVASAAVVRTDPVLLERILRNLVVNAIRNTRRGGVVVGCRRVGGRLRVEVWDTGQGIPADRLDDIFLEFYRIKGGGDDGRGLGLGLSIVARLAQLLGHPVTVASRLGRGSVFRVEMALGSRDRVAPEPEALLAVGNVAGAVVALVDDDETVLRSTRRLLEDWGCRVIAAPSAGCLLDLLAEDEAAPDLIVADYQLEPGLSGLDAVRMVRAAVGAAVPAIVITANTDPALVLKARAADCKLMHKPLRPSRMRSMVALLLHPLDALVTKPG